MNSVKLDIIFEYAKFFCTFLHIFFIFVDYQYFTMLKIRQYFLLFGKVKGFFCNSGNLFRLLEVEINPHRQVPFQRIDKEFAHIRSLFYHSLLTEIAICKAQGLNYLCFFHIAFLFGVIKSRCHLLPTVMSLIFGNASIISRSNATALRIAHVNFIWKIPKKIFYLNFFSYRHIAAARNRCLCSSNLLFIFYINKRRLPSFCFY